MKKADFAKKIEEIKAKDTLKALDEFKLEQFNEFIENLEKLRFKR